MNVTTTGIAVAVALAVVAVFFIFPGFSPFSVAPQTAPASDLSVTSGQTAATAATTSTSAMTTPDGLQITDNVVGTGATAAAGDSVTVNYVGTLADGTVFDASAKHGSSGFTFALGAGQVIKGWDEGVVGMKVGGTRTLVIPSALAYGSAGVPGVIPANATLTFQVQLLSVTPAQ
ncbi:MAG: FKBP-type peptidyl-prolyl cis-trans isomerase [Minisyncoccia bacterium]